MPDRGSVHLRHGAVLGGEGALTVNVDSDVCRTKTRGSLVTDSTGGGLLGNDKNLAPHAFPPPFPFPSFPLPPGWAMAVESSDVENSTAMDGGVLAARSDA
jgi:hypothetical protein